MTIDWTANYNQWARFTDCVNSMQRLGPFVEAVQDYAPGKRLLEAGVGKGAVAMYLAENGFNVTALDNNREVLERVERLAGVFGIPMSFIEADVRSTAFPDDSFDVCYHQGVLEHFPPEEMLMIIDEQLRIAHTVVFSVPNACDRPLILGSEYLYTCDQWLNLLSPFRVIHYDGFNYDLAYRNRINRLPWRAFPRRVWSSVRIAHARELLFVVRREP